MEYLDSFGVEKHVDLKKRLIFLNLLFVLLCLKKLFLNQDYALPTPLETNLRNRVSVTL